MAKTSEKTTSRYSVTKTGDKYDKLAKRLVELMNERSESVRELSDKIGVSQQAISQYQTTVAFPKMETLLKMANHFDCSVNYLAGISDVRSSDARLEYICEYTGLSQDAVELLHLISQSKIKESKRTTQLLNIVLSDPHLVRKDDEFPVDTLFSLMDQYIDADTVKLSGRYGELEERRHMVSLESSDEMIEAESVAALYKQLKLKKIVEKLDYYQKMRTGESK